MAEAQRERDGEERGEKLPDGADWQAFIIREQHRDTSPTTGKSNFSYVVAAGGRIIIPPYPAANELSGIYRIKYARGVDSREVKSYIRSLTPSGIETLRLSLESMHFKRV